MASVNDHYEKLLAPIYTWMAGGAESAIAAGWEDLDGRLPAGRFAIDLGAGFGMHTIALARHGWRVLAIDTSPQLLNELTALAKGWPVTAVCEDLLHFRDHLPAGENPDLVLCMGDTLTHLATQRHARDLCHAVGFCLRPGGTFIATFRDYTQPVEGTARFIPVRADEDRLLTCFIECAGDHVRVHDLLYQRAATGWQFTVSDYQKLRLAPDSVAEALRSAGLNVVCERAPRGMVRVVATA